MNGLKSFINKATESAELHILDDIGPSWAGMVGAKGVAAELKAIGSVKTLDVHVNSMGGSVFEGFAIYNLIKDHSAAVTMHVDGIAASAASAIVMAGDTIKMAKNSFLMIHNPSVIMWGEAKDLRKEADVLDSLKVKIACIYADRGNKDSEAFSTMMDDETWLDADAAVEYGLADEVNANKAAVLNSLSPRTYSFANLPDAVRNLPKCEMPQQSEPPLRRRLDAWKQVGARIGK